MEITLESIREGLRQIDADNMNDIIKYGGIQNPLQKLTYYRTIKGRGLKQEIYNDTEALKHIDRKNQKDLFDYEQILIPIKRILDYNKEANIKTASTGRGLYMKEYNKKYYAKNKTEKPKTNKERDPALRAEQNRRYYQANKEKFKVKEDKKEDYAIYRKEYYDKNKEYFKEKNRKFREAKKLKQLEEQL